MKKLLSLVLVLALVLSSAVALADISSAKVVDTKERKINVKAAGDNEVEDGISPTTGRSLDELADLAEPGTLGMAITGEYYPVMVQHCGYNSALGVAAPWYGSYADIIYELPKAKGGVTRMCFVFNDYLPPFAGASRSTRVGYISIRQEWGAPYFYAGQQDDAYDWQKGKCDTNVSRLIRELGLITDVSANDQKLPQSSIQVFNGLDNKKFRTYTYRWTGDKSGYNNYLWGLPDLYTNILTVDADTPREFKNHTFKFADDVPTAGDSAETVYVFFDKDNAANGDGDWYFNCMYEYDEDENAYYRYAITDLSNPENNPLLFEEQVVAPGTETKVTPVNGGGNTIDIQSVPGDPITFANIIIQGIEDKWPGNEMPYPVLTGTGNADYFMGGKHIAGVWKRDTIEDRTVFYDENGEEIELQPGRTIIIGMDYDSLYQRNKDDKGRNPREVRYE